MSSENFGREYRVAIGKAGEAGFEIGQRSESRPVPLHINFSIERTDLETQNTGRITIWNLNKQHLAALEEKDCCLSLKAGYQNRLPLIFSGIGHGQLEDHLRRCGRPDGRGYLILL